jgi:hypothetical protein
MTTKETSYADEGVGEGEDGDEIGEGSGRSFVATAIGAASLCVRPECVENSPQCLGEDGLHKLYEGCTLECLAKQTDDEVLANLLDDAQVEMTVTGNDTENSFLHASSLVYDYRDPGEKPDKQKLEAIKNRLIQTTNISAEHTMIFPPKKEVDDISEPPKPAAREVEPPKPTVAELVENIKIEFDRPNKCFSYATFVPWSDEDECTFRLAKVYTSAQSGRIVIINGKENDDESKLKAGNTHLLHAMYQDFVKNNEEDADRCVLTSGERLKELYQEACGFGFGDDPELTEAGRKGYIKYLADMRAIFVDDVQKLGDKSSKAFGDVLRRKSSDCLVVCTFKDDGTENAGRVKVLLDGMINNINNFMLDMPDDDAAKKQHIIEIVKVRIADQNCLPAERRGEYENLPRLIMNRLDKFLEPGFGFRIDDFIDKVDTLINETLKKRYDERGVEQLMMFETSKDGKRFKYPPKGALNDPNVDFPSEYLFEGELKIGPILDMAVRSCVIPVVRIIEAEPEEDEDEEEPKKPAKKTAAKKPAGGAKKSSGKQAGTTSKRGGKKMHALDEVVKRGIEDGSIFVY